MYAREPGSCLFCSALHLYLFSVSLLLFPILCHPGSPPAHPLSKSPDAAFYPMARSPYPHSERLLWLCLLCFSHTSQAGPCSLTDGSNCTSWISTRSFPVSSLTALPSSLPATSMASLFIAPMCRLLSWARQQLRPSTTLPFSWQDPLIPWSRLGYSTLFSKWSNRPLIQSNCPLSFFQNHNMEVCFFRL